MNLFVDVARQDKDYLYLLLGEVDYVKPLAVFKVEVDDETVEEKIIEFQNVTYNKKDPKIFHALGCEMNPVYLLSGINNYNKNKDDPDSSFHKLCKRLYDHWKDNQEVLNKK